MPLIIVFGISNGHIGKGVGNDHDIGETKDNARRIAVFLMMVICIDGTKTTIMIRLVGVY